jgi:hypothetical protein
MALVKAGMIRLYDPDEDVDRRAVLAELEAAGHRLTHQDPKRDFHLMLAAAIGRFELGDEEALEHLLAAAQAGAAVEAFHGRVERTARQVVSRLSHKEARGDRLVPVLPPAPQLALEEVPQPELLLGLAEQGAVHQGLGARVGPVVSRGEIENGAPPRRRPVFRPPEGLPQEHQVGLELLGGGSVGAHQLPRGVQQQAVRIAVRLQVHAGLEGHEHRVVHLVEVTRAGVLGGVLPCPPNHLREAVQALFVPFRAGRRLQFGRQLSQDASGHRAPRVVRLGRRRPRQQDAQCRQRAEGDRRQAALKGQGPTEKTAAVGGAAAWTMGKPEAHEGLSLSAGTFNSSPPGSSSFASAPDQPLATSGGSDGGRRAVLHLPQHPALAAPARAAEGPRRRVPRPGSGPRTALGGRRCPPVRWRGSRALSSRRASGDCGPSVGRPCAAPAAGAVCLLAALACPGSDCDESGRWL